MKLKYADMQALKVLESRKDKPGGWGCSTKGCYLG